MYIKLVNANVWEHGGNKYHWICVKDLWADSNPIQMQFGYDVALK